MNFTKVFTNISNKAIMPFSSIFRPKQNLYLGRWKLKHDHNKCENYILNYHADPGYPNSYKYNNKWIKKSIL